MLDEHNETGTDPHTASPHTRVIHESYEDHLSVLPVGQSPVPSPESHASLGAVDVVREHAGGGGVRQGLMGGVADAGLGPVWLSPRVGARDTANSPAPPEFETNVEGFVKSLVGTKRVPRRELMRWVDQKLREGLTRLGKALELSPYTPLTRDEERELTDEQKEAYTKWKTLQEALGGDVVHVKMQLYRALFHALNRGQGESAAADFLWIFEEYLECEIYWDDLARAVEIMEGTYK